MLREVKKILCVKVNHTSNKKTSNRFAIGFCDFIGKNISGVVDEFCSNESI